MINVWEIGDIAVDRNGEVGVVAQCPDGIDVLTDPYCVWFERHHDGHTYLIGWRNLSEPNLKQVDLMVSEEGIAAAFLHSQLNRHAEKIEAAGIAALGKSIG